MEALIDKAESREQKAESGKQTDRSRRIENRKLNLSFKP